MQYEKQYIQKTVMADDPAAFDRELNAIYQQATSERQLPEIHYFDHLGLCATVRYYATVEIPETARDRFYLDGIRHTCMDCVHYRPSFDGRVKWVKCEFGGCLSCRTSEACEAHYEELERREVNNGSPNRATPQPARGIEAPAAHEGGSRQAHGDLRAVVGE